MKPTYSIILFILSVLVFIGTFKYSSTQQKRAAKEVFDISKNTRAVNNSVKSTNQRQFELFEYSKHSNGADFKAFFKQIHLALDANRAFRNDLDDFCLELFKIKNPFYHINEEESQSIEFANPTFIFPFSKKETKTIIQKYAPKMERSYASFIKKATNALKDTSLFNTSNREELQLLQYENIAALDSFKHDMKALESVVSIEKYFSEFDFLQLQLLLLAFQQRYYLFENAVINNFKNAKRNIQNNEIGNQNFALLLYSEDHPIIGKDYELNAYLSNYITNETIEMQVNGRQIPVKNGIGYYESKNKKTFYVTISLINPMTNKRDVYGRHFRQ